ncbi:MAG: hypothetical protein ACMG6E_09675 [Candidatus Roizmanbacteria bacterium]
MLSLGFVNNNFDSINQQEYSPNMLFDNNSHADIFSQQSKRQTSIKSRQAPYESCNTSSKGYY